MDLPESISAFRRQFPQLRGNPRPIYFNHAATGIMPASVVKASIEGVKTEQPYPLSPATNQLWRETKAETRRMAAELINTAPENIAFVTSTSVALSMVALAIPWQKGDNVITVNVENPATIVPWQNLGHLGVEVRYLSAGPDDIIDVDAIKNLADDKTRLIALSLVEYSTGQRLDIARVAQWARPRGILISVDGVQAVGAIPVDVKALGMNFLSFGIQKWLLGPKNIAVLYADNAALDVIRSPIVTEESVANIYEEEERPTQGPPPQLKIHQGALKLEAVSNSNFPGMFGLRQALRNFQSFGAPAIHQRLRDLTDELVKGLNKLDGRVVSPRGDNEWSGVVSFLPLGAPTREVVAQLRQQNVYVALRKGRIRISLHFYNTSAEIRKFLSLLKKANRPAAAPAPAAPTAATVA